MTAEVWSPGRRNPLGLAFDESGRLWNVEMGPSGGDELNVVRRGANYGYPVVSNGNHYDGRNIPDHDTRPEFVAPAVSWTPGISPSSLMFYSGSEFPDWRGDAFEQSNKCQRGRYGCLRAGAQSAAGMAICLDSPPQLLTNTSKETVWTHPTH